MRSAVFMIYICIDNHPFENSVSKKMRWFEILNVKRLERPIELGFVSYEQRLDEVFM